jgi:hypothetical protein
MTYEWNGAVSTVLHNKSHNKSAKFARLRADGFLLAAFLLGPSTLSIPAWLDLSPGAVAL